MVIENPYDAEWSWSGPNEPLDVPAKEDAAWYKPFIAEIQAQETARDGVGGETSPPGAQR